MPLLDTWNSKWIPYVTQYAGVPKFNSTVADIRDLKIDVDLEACDKFTASLGEYKVICIRLHDLSRTPNDPNYQRTQRQVREVASLITGEYDNYVSEIGKSIKKLAKAFKSIEAKEKYLTENRRPAADLVNAIKDIDKKLSLQKSMIASQPIGVTLDEIRRDPRARG